MKTSLLYAIVVFAVIMIVMPPSIAYSEKYSAQSSTKRAVIVGINDYKRSPLNYCVNDANAIEEALRKMGVTEIIKLLDRDATRANVVRALKDYIDKSTSSDMLFFSFSGHGTDFVWDRDGHEALVLLDKSGDSPLSALLVDEDIDALFRRCEAKTIVYIFDCCFAGGVARSIDVERARYYYDPDWVKDKELIPSDARSVSTLRRRDAPSNPRTIVLAASQANEKSFESGFIRHGYFTYHLLQAFGPRAPSIAGRDGSLTVSKVFEHVKDSVSKATSRRQNPAWHLGAKADDINFMNLSAIGTTEMTTESTTSPDAGIPFNTPAEIQIQLPQILHSTAQITETDENDQLVVLPPYNLQAWSGRTSYKVHDEFDLTISVDETCYLYFFNIELNGTTEVVFPNKVNSSNLIQAGQQMTIRDMVPGYKLRVKSDSPKGINLMLVIASPYELPLDSIPSLSWSEEGLVNELKSAYGYGSRGVISGLIDAVGEGYKSVEMVPIDTEETAPSLAAKRSLVSVMLSYYVE